MATSTFSHESLLTLDLEKTPVAAFTVDSQHRIVTCNQSAELLFGSPASGLAGQRCSHIMSGRLLAACLGCPERCSARLPDVDASSATQVPSSITLVRSDSISQVVISVLRTTTAEHQPRFVHLLQVLSQGTPPPSAHDERDTEPSAPSPTSVVHLTQREREILHMLAKGLDTPEIAAQSYISRATARTHIQNIIAKLGATNRLQAVLMANEQGLVSLTSRSIHLPT